MSLGDQAEARLLPPPLQYPYGHAPGVGIESYRFRRRDVLRELAGGTLDFLVDSPLLTDPNVPHSSLLADAYVCVARKGGPRVTDGLDLDAFLEVGHILTFSRPRCSSHVDLALERLGVRRQIALRSQHYLTAPAIVARTDLAITVPRGFAESLVQDQASQLLPLRLPFEVQQPDSHLYWHASADQDSGHLWLRGLLMEIGMQDR